MRFIHRALFLFLATLVTVTFLLMLAINTHQSHQNLFSEISYSSDGDNPLQDIFSANVVGKTKLFTFSNK